MECSSRPSSAAWSTRSSCGLWPAPRAPTERNRHEIGDALDLHWAASANKESIVVEAYDYAQQLDWRPGLGRQPLTWTCLACQQTFIDHGLR